MESNQSSGVVNPTDRLRTSGILCHITSLRSTACPSQSADSSPIDIGIGNLGVDAMRFVDYLADAGQTWWQMLPLGPPAHNQSPYSCYSAMAGNRFMICPQSLVDDGLLTQTQVDDVVRSGDSSQRFANAVDFESAENAIDQLLKIAFDCFQEGNSKLNEPFDAFVADQSSWLTDFALFEALMVHFDELDWTKWPAGLPSRDAATLRDWSNRLADETRYVQFVQFIFDFQWNRLKQYASSKGVKLCGDMPIFVAHESSDVWANQELFCLDDAGRPALVAGVPPDYFSKTGQLWGNPQYDWEAIESTGYRWWTDRFARALDQFGLLRVDHFRGFEAYWAVPAKAKTAIGGSWLTGPGAKPFQAAASELGELPLIAEDLGMITAEVYALRDQLGFPGMRVLQFGFDEDDYLFHRPSEYPAHSVAYTGTHDNDTVMGWYRQRSKDKKFVERIEPFLDDQLSIHFQLIDAVLKSDAETTFVPIQDLSGLGNEARMNVPGKAKGNWGWRLSPKMLTDSMAEQMRAITESSGRC